jgi:ElaB/YqjD/DUF883 family membrane-anchored ribosome-binding protein
MDTQAGSVDRLDTIDDADDVEVTEVEVTRARIEQTRSEMGETIDAIKEKLNPQTLAQQAKETVREATIGRAQEAASSAVDTAKEAVSGAVDTAREVVSGAVDTAREAMSNVGETARDAGSTMMETIRRNPAAVGLIGIGLSWLWMSSRQERTSRPFMDRRYAYDELRGTETAPRYDTMAGYAGASEGATERRGDGATARVGETLREAREKVGEVAGQVQEKAGQFVSRAQDQVSQLGTQATVQAQRAEDAFQRMLYQNPVAAGAVALGLGAALGLVIPETEKENRMMGEARDQLVDRVQEKAQDVTQKVQSVAQEAVSAATETAREEAKNQGLSPTG